MERTEQLLMIVGNETRRRILALLSEKPNYILELSRKLSVTQPAILKHLDLLEKSGLIESFLKESPFGAPRKYYKICDSVGIEIAIDPKDFKVTRHPRGMSCPKYLDMGRVVEQLTGEINRAQDLGVKACKARKLMETADALLSCENHEDGNWMCENCHRMALVRKEVSEIILHVSRGEIESGLRKLTETINHLVSNLLPK